MKRKRLTVLLVMAIGVAILYAQRRTLYFVMMGMDRKMDAAYQALHTEMTKEEVFLALGKGPTWTNRQFCLPQYHGYEAEFAKTNGVDATVYYMWGNGINWYYCVGFDQRDRMVVKGQGGS